MTPLLSPWCEDCELRIDKCRCHPSPPAPAAICIRDASGVPASERMCPQCGHWWGAHPVRGGSLEACIFCELVALRDALTAKLRQ